MSKLFTKILLLLALPMLLHVEGEAQGKNFIKGLKGQDSLSISRVWAATMVVPGYGQAYNEQYWKIPVIYAGAGSLSYLGYHFNTKKQDAWNDYQQAIALNLPSNVIMDLESTYNGYKHKRTAAYIGAAAFYIGGALDAVYQYKTDKPIVAARPTIYSSLVPGLGQIYNGHYYKLPIIYGGLAFCGYLVNFNSTQYHRYRAAFNNVTSGLPDEFNGQLSAANLQYYRDSYRRNRDYSVLALAAVYVLNIIDAQVYAYLADYDISDDLSMRFQPTIIGDPMFASTSGMAVGFNLTLKFK